MIFAGWKILKENTVASDDLTSLRQNLKVVTCAVVRLYVAADHGFHDSHASGLNYLIQIKR